MKCVTLIPYRPRDERSRQLWDWASYFLADLHWPIFCGDDGQEPFSRAGSLNAAAEAAGNWDVALLGDADTVQDVSSAHVAAEMVHEAGNALIPWKTRIKLSQQGTLKFVQRGTADWNDRDRRDPTSGTKGGGTLMVSRKAWDTVGGLDASFRGYGDEDLAFIAALETLVAKVERTDGTCWHLWHAPARFVGTDRAATPENHERWLRYKQAKGNPEAMRELVDGARALVP